MKTVFRQDQSGTSAFVNAAKYFSTLMSESFESDTSDVLRRGLNETLESAAMRNIRTLAGGTTADWPIQFSVDISLVIPDLRVSHHDIDFGC